MTPGDRPNLPWETEPSMFLHPVLTGGARPLGVQPAPGPFGLEEEPALWPEVIGRPAAARDVSLAPVRLRHPTSSRPANSPSRVRPAGLAATGLRTQLPLAGVLTAALAALLHRRNVVAKQER